MSKTKNALWSSHQVFTPAAHLNFSSVVSSIALLVAPVLFATLVLASSAFAASTYDGPAELPRVTVPSAIVTTPAHGAIIAVNAGDNLQLAVNNAQCGDVLQLQAGATFTGLVTLPAKNCDNAHWIWIRTSAPDSALPAEGQRLTPCYAGVAALAGRPQYACVNPQNVMAKVQMLRGGDGPFKFATGANYYRFIGLEVTRAAGAPGSARLITAHGTADHVIVDRSWLHGLPQDETRVGVSLSGVTNAAIVDSYFSDFHCIAVSGGCTDSHAVGGGVSNTQDGPFKIQNNFLEASGQGVLFGGGPASATPADIQILNNHFWKAWQWMRGNANFVGGPDGNPFIVKNHLELKNASRVLIDGNLMENNWGGFTEGGYGVVIAPKSQHMPDGSNACSLCQVTDITFRYGHLSHSGAGFRLATALSGNGVDGGPALAGARWSIHDVVLDDLSTKYVGNGTAIEIMNTWQTNPLNSVTINHVTAFPDSGSHILTIGNSIVAAPMYGLVFTNNLMITGRYPVWNTGGTGSCAASNIPLTVIDNCFATKVFSNNGLVGTPAAFPPTAWPSNNLFAPTIAEVQFANYNNGVNGNYQLMPSSCYKSMGNDGKDLGANITQLNAAMASVE